MLYSIVNKLDFENMAQNLIFLLSQCPGATQPKIEFFLLKSMKNIGYTDLNISMSLTFEYIHHKKGLGSVISI